MNKANLFKMLNNYHPDHVQITSEPDGLATNQVFIEIYKLKPERTAGKSIHIEGKRYQRTNMIAFYRTGRKDYMITPEVEQRLAKKIKQAESWCREWGKLEPVSS